MKILNIITGLSRGGAEAMLYKLLAGSDPSSMRHSVISLSDPGVYGERITALGIPVHCLNMQPDRLDARSLIRLRRLVRELDPDLIQGWMYHGMLASRMAAGGRPVIAAIRHSLYDIADEKPLTRLIIRACAAMSGSFDRITYNSHVSRAQHEARGFVGTRAVVIPNGFDTDRLRPDPERRHQMRMELGIGPHQCAVFQLARLHPMKDHAGLLAAIARIDDPNLVFLFAGTGVQAGNPPFDGALDPRIRLLGERDDVPDLLQAADLLVNPSWSEAFPNVLGEAMACGVPCIASDVGDSARIVGDTGKIIPPRDRDALAAAITSMAALDDATRRALGVPARTRVVDNYSLIGIVRAYEALYESVMAERVRTRQ
ncbi:MAG: glycosyltransferase [Rhodothalassiaceae bacterium]